MKTALSRLWQVHSIDLDAPSQRDGVGSELDERSYQCICRLHQFFVETVRRAAATTSGDPTGRTSTFSALRHLLQPERTALPAGGQREPQQSHPTTTGVAAPAETVRYGYRSLPEGRHVVCLDHRSLCSELTRFEHESENSSGGGGGGGVELPDDFAERYSFDHVLRNHPARAIVMLEVAIGLLLVQLLSDALGSSAESEMSKVLERNRYCACLINVRPTTRMIDIKTIHVRRLVAVRGRVGRVRPKALRPVDADFICHKCREFFPERLYDGIYNPPSRCVTQGCKSRNFTIQRSTARFVDVQRIRLQELQDESVCDAGRVPRQLEVELVDDLVDCCATGDAVCVVGIVRAVSTAVATGKRGRVMRETSTYNLYLQANSVSKINLDRDGLGSGSDDDDFDGGGTMRDPKRDDKGPMSFSSEQLSSIVEVAHADHLYGPMSMRMAFPFHLLVHSICPSIVGCDMVKAGILLGLLGGSSDSALGPSTGGAIRGTPVRSSIHVLIVGEPGMGKSQLLRAVAQIMPRSIYVCGATTSSTGLTAAMVRDSGSEPSIDAGALVLADGGVRMIDELDKVKKSHQDGLLEAMEQERVSIAKAGALLSLQHRCCSESEAWHLR